MADDPGAGREPRPDRLEQRDVTLTYGQILRVGEIARQLLTEGRRVYAGTLFEIIERWEAAGAEPVGIETLSEVWYQPPEDPGGEPRFIEVLAREKSPNGFTIFCWSDTGERDRLRHPEFMLRFRREGT